MTARADAVPQYAYSTVNWITAVFMVLFHVAAISAFWFFSWPNVIAAIVLHWLAVGFGISLGYHRLHTHRGFKTSKAFEFFPAVRDVNLEGGPIFWCRPTVCTISTRTRKVTARRTTALLGPHGLDSLRRHHHNNTALMSKRAGPAADPFYRWLNTYHYVPLTTVGVFLLAIGGWSMVLGIGCGWCSACSHLAGGSATHMAAAGSTRATIRATAGGWPR
jgi:stearoyl-CoA desaturase (delta-9 desaturase)